MFGVIERNSRTSPPVQRFLWPLPPLSVSSVVAFPFSLSPYLACSLFSTSHLKKKKNSQDTGVESSLHKLSLAPSPRGPAPKPTSHPVADSWEEEADSSSSTSRTPSPPQTPTSSNLPLAPPPTPISATYSISHRPDWPSAHFPPTRQNASSASEPLQHRPEKQTAVAGRIIAGALGVKAPAKSEEGRAYEKAMREKEKKRLEREREERRREEEEQERAKREVWEA